MFTFQSGHKGIKIGLQIQSFAFLYLTGSVIHCDDNCRCRACLGLYYWVLLRTPENQRLYLLPQKGHIRYGWSLWLVTQLPTQILQLGDDLLQSRSAVLQLSMDLSCGHVCVHLLEDVYNGRVDYKVINVNLYHWEEWLNNPNAYVYKSSRLTFVLIASWMSLFRQNRWFEWCHNLVKILCQAACWQHLHEHVLPPSLTKWRPRAKEVLDTLLLSSQETREPIPSATGWGYNLNKPTFLLIGCPWWTEAGRCGFLAHSQSCTPWMSL